MDNVDISSRMRYLCDVLNRYGYEYYVLSSPTVSDKEYDALYDELVSLEKSSGTVFEDSPTRKVGGEILEGFSSVRHRIKLYSLDKAQNHEQLISWYNRLKKQYDGDVSFTVENKYDGLSISILYSGGNFVRAVTRGNGIIGEDVTAQVRTIKSLPLSISFKGTAEIQGEGLMRLSVLNQLNNSDSGEILKNARNAAAGSIRNLDTAIAARRRLDLVVYGVNYIEGKKLYSQLEIFEFLKKNNFLVSGHRHCLDIDSVYEAIKYIETQREKLDFLIDGAVVKVNEFDARMELKETEKFPRWAVAYKFEAQEITTTVTKVEWNVGRTGRLTPLAHLVPVELSGATVSRATLNNYRDIERKGVKLGARVLVRRSNDVIPEILGTTEYPKDSTDIQLPKVCPACKYPVYDDGINLFCKNTISCKPQLVSAIEHFCSRDAMDIEGLSEKTAELLYEKLSLRDVAGIYGIRYDDLLTLDGFKQKKAHNLINAIEKSKVTTLSRFLYALSIPNIGVKASSDLAAKFGTLEAVMSAEVQQLTEVRDFGAIMADSVYNFFRLPQNIALINQLLEAGIKFEQQRVQNSGGAYSGIKAVITGTIDGYTRSEVKKIIEDGGGEVMSSVSKNTDVLLCGEDAGSKLNKAAELGIKVLQGNELAQFLKK